MAGRSNGSTMKVLFMTSEKEGQADKKRIEKLKSDDNIDTKNYSTTKTKSGVSQIFGMPSPPKWWSTSRSCFSRQGHITPNKGEWSLVQFGGASA